MFLEKASRLINVELERGREREREREGGRERGRGGKLSIH
jgi:hypothetical protein